MKLKFTLHHRSYTDYTKILKTEKLNFMIVISMRIDVIDIFFANSEETIQIDFFESGKC